MTDRQAIRQPTHAGSWYDSSKARLDSELQGWLDAVESPVTCIGPHSASETVHALPVPGARIIIAP